MALNELPAMGRSGTRAPQSFDLAGMAPDALIDLRSRIDEHMPIRKLKDLNLEDELVMQLQVVQRLQSDAATDDAIPANQRAQVAGQVANVLAKLGTLQTEVYTSERLKKLEALLIEALKALPTKQQESFLVRYEAMLEGRGGG